MKLLSKITSGLVLGSSLLFSVPASAAPLPSVYSRGWSQHSVKPAWIVLGTDSVIEAHTWSWSTWNATTARSAGTLWVNSCKPTCSAGHYTYHKLNVTLATVKKHGSVPYFWQMTWNTPGYKMPGQSSSTVVMFYSLTGGTIPQWASCYPLSSSKTCYEPGEFCRNSDHNKTGLAGNGLTIKCENRNSWRWETI